MNRGRRTAKRGLDLAISGSLLVLGLPLLALIAVLVRLRLGSPVLFRQQRPGLRGALFPMLKFRTMTDARDGAGRLLPDQDRLTPLGRFLRRSSLDELPELWNVLCGQMSLVGPRPLLPEYLDHYTPAQARRHDVPPGVTGWAQVNGRNAIAWDRKFELDVWYVDHQSLRLDLKILWRTAFQVLRRDGISRPGHATMPRFAESPAAVAPAATVSLASAAMATVEAATVEAATVEAVAIIGGGGHAKVVIETARAAGFAIAGIYDDDPALRGRTIAGARVEGPVDLLAHATGRPALIAIGNCQRRAALAARLPCHWIVAVHPSAVIGGDVQIAAGTVVMAGAVVQTGTRIGRHVIVNTSASVDHDCHIEDFVHLAPGTRLAGGVTVGRQAFCGIASAIVPGMRLGERSILGAGAVAVGDLPADVVAVGVPARVRRTLAAPADQKAA